MMKNGHLVVLSHGLDNTTNGHLACVKAGYCNNVGTAVCQVVACS